MKVLQISPVVPPHKAGMATAAGEIFKATSRLGLDVSLVSANGESSVKGMRHFSPPGLGLLSFTPAILRLAKDADLIHLHYPCYGNALMVSLARLLGARKPLVVSYHMDTVGRGLRRPVFWLHSKFLAPRFLRRAEKIAVASRDYAEHSLLAKYPELMDKVVEIPFGIDCERFRPGTLTTSDVLSSALIRKSESGLASDPPCPKRGEECRRPLIENEGVGGVLKKNILFVGGLDEQHYFKGFHVLLEAVAKIPGVKLTAVGSGKLVKRYARKACELGIDERVIFAGRVSDGELPECYRQADVFCLPSLDRSEAYGIVLTEALASGVPCVASDIPGVRSVVRSGETGFLFLPGDAEALADALKKILGDDAMRKKMAKAAREFALSRSWEDAGKKYLEIYRSVIG